jgi:hypothetical protein
VRKLFENVPQLFDHDRQCLDAPDVADDVSIRAMTRDATRNDGNSTAL